VALMLAGVALNWESCFLCDNFFGFCSSYWRHLWIMSLVTARFWEEWSQSL